MTTADEKMREEFEREHRKKNPDTMLFKRGGSVFAEDVPESEYSDTTVQYLWQVWQTAWQASAAQYSERIKELEQQNEQLQAGLTKRDEERDSLNNMQDIRIEQLQAQVAMLTVASRDYMDNLSQYVTRFGEKNTLYLSESKLRVVISATTQTAEAYKRRIQAEAMKWQPIETAPKDGTLLLLWVEFEHHPTEDAFSAVTMGANNFKHDGEDVWKFAGWNWEYDCFTEGIGTPKLWLPLQPMTDAAELKEGE